MDGKESQVVLRRIEPWRKERLCSPPSVRTSIQAGTAREMFHRSARQKLFIILAR